MMNDSNGATTNNQALTQRPQQSAAFSGQGQLIIELAKCLKLVAPISMSEDAQKVWLQAAVDALNDIRPEEVQMVSTEVRRTVTRAAQIVPEIARLVAERRERRARMREYDTPALTGPPPPKHVMERRGEPMSEEDTAELNRILESLRAKKRYRPDGSKFDAA